MKIDVKKDLSVLTTVNELSISRLFDKIDWIICDAIENANLSEEDLLELDLGFGVLQIIRALRYNLSSFNVGIFIVVPPKIAHNFNKSFSFIV